VLDELDNAGVEIPVVSVVKDDNHDPKDVLGPSSAIEDNRQEIMLANSEAHRFVQSFHENKRRKRLTG
jgi:excinuclease UvrABC nuclease subunit